MQLTSQFAFNATKSSLANNNENSKMSSHAPRFDQDGDVEMAVAQPIFEFIKTPRLAVWSQQALVKFLRDRRQYETKMAERCRATSEAYDTVVVSIKSSLEPRVLDHVARFFVRKDPFDVIDAEILQQMERKAGAMLNQQVPDIPKLFEAQLKMDLQEPDIEARVAKFLSTSSALLRTMASCQ
jgi:hypothetical protein